VLVQVIDVGGETRPAGDTAATAQALVALAAKRCPAKEFPEMEAVLEAGPKLPEAA
jgi:hypothetical protein